MMAANDASPPISPQVELLKDNSQGQEIQQCATDTAQVAEQCDIKADLPDPD